MKTICSFDNKYIPAPTFAQFTELIYCFKAMGLAWSSGDLIDKSEAMRPAGRHWGTYKEDTCLVFDFGVRYGDIKGKTQDCIVSFKRFKELIMPEPNDNYFYIDPVNYKIETDVWNCELEDYLRYKFDNVFFSEIFANYTLNRIIK